MKNKETFQLEFYDVLEFTYAAILFTYDDFEKEVKEASIEGGCNRTALTSLSKEMLSFRNQMLSSCSEYMKAEIRYFFGKWNNICDGLGQNFLLYFIKQKPNVETVEELIERIQKSDAIRFAQILCKYLYFEAKSKKIEEDYDWVTVSKDPAKMANIVRNLQVSNTVKKASILDCMEHYTEVKQRFLMVLTIFNESIYPQLRLQIKKKTEAAITNYQKELISPERFFRKYVSSNYKEFDETLRIHVSYCRFAGADLWSANEGETEWLVLGSENYELLEEESKEKKVTDFLSVIADSKRQKIIKLLTDRAYYVNEIAQMMDMTASTTSYHLTKLQMLGIVDYQRTDHRFYYFLNKEKMKEWFLLTMEYYSCSPNEKGE